MAHDTPRNGNMFLREQVSSCAKLGERGWRVTRGKSMKRGKKETTCGMQKHIHINLKAQINTSFKKRYVTFTQSYQYL